MGEKKYKYIDDPDMYAATIRAVCWIQSRIEIEDVTDAAIRWCAAKYGVDMKELAKLVLERKDDYSILERVERNRARREARRRRE